MNAPILDCNLHDYLEIACLPAALRCLHRDRALRPMGLTPVATQQKATRPVNCSKLAPGSGFCCET